MQPFKVQIQPKIFAFLTLRTEEFLLQSQTEKVFISFSFCKKISRISFSGLWKFQIQYQKNLHFSDSYSTVKLSKHGTQLLCGNLLRPLIHVDQEVYRSLQKCKIWIAIVFTSRFSKSAFILCTCAFWVGPWISWGKGRASNLRANTLSTSLTNKGENF